MKRRDLLLPLLILALFLPSVAHGQTKKKMSGPVDISAREMRYDREKNIITAEGDVEIVQGTSRLTADYAELRDERYARADGHVVFQDQGDVVHAEKMTYDLETAKGTIETGKIHVQQGNFYVTGNEIEKTGESTYVVHEGEFTTCGWDRPAWTFAAKNVELTVGGYATAQHATFRILGQKVLYFPWGIFPVKTERQSGFLIPELQLSSRDGTIFRSAYFWAISKDTDATFFGDWIQDRGVKPGVEYRYALTENTKGTWYGTILDDVKYKHTRYQIRGKHEQLLGDMQIKADIDHVSDFDYLKDLGRSSAERSQNSLRSVAFAEKPFSRSLLTGGATYFDYLTAKNRDQVLSYLPSVSYFTEYLPVLGKKLYVDMDSALTRFDRDEGDTFTRLTVEPTVRLPYSAGGLNLLFSGGIVENSYLMGRHSDDGNDTRHHEAVKAEMDLNAQFLKTGRTALFRIGNYDSVILPRIRYRYLKNTTSFSDVPSIDPSDRLSNMNAVTYSFNHYLNVVTDGQAREVSLLEIEQTYGISDDLEAQPYLYEGSGHRLSDVKVRFTMYPHPNLGFTNEDVLNVYGDGLRIIRNSVTYAFPPVFQVSLSHSYTRKSVNELWVNALGKWKKFDANYQLRYSLLEGRWVDTLASVTYHPSCWGVTATLQKTRRPKDTSIHFSFSLEGITQKLGGF